MPFDISVGWCYYWAALCRFCVVGVGNWFKYCLSKSARDWAVHCIQRFVGNIQRLVQAEMRLVYFLLHISDFISVRLYERVTCGIWTLSRLWWCSWYQSVLSQVYTRYGKCYTFNGNKTTSRKTKQGGMGNGLEIMLDIQQDEYLPIWRETSKLQNYLSIVILSCAMLWHTLCCSLNQ